MALTSIRVGKNSPKKIIRYVTSPEKTVCAPEEWRRLHPDRQDVTAESRVYVSALNCAAETAAEQFRETRELKERLMQPKRPLTVNYLHGYQSFEDLDPETVHEIGVKLAMRLWGEEHAVLIATHLNTGTFHNHFVVDPVSLTTFQMIRTRQDDYRTMRRESDRLCLEYGCGVVEDPSRRISPYVEMMMERRGEPTIRGMIRADIDRAVRASRTKREFLENLKKLGYLYSPGSEKNGFRPGLRPVWAEHPFLFYRLGKEYVPERLSERIAENAERAPLFTKEEKEGLARYREEHDPREEPGSLPSLYRRYLYELRLLKNFPAAVDPVSNRIRNDVVRLSSLDKQSRLLGENRIETREELEAFREKAESEMALLKKERARLQRRAKYLRVFPEKGDDMPLRKEAVSLTPKIAELRKTISLCDEIERRSPVMRERTLELARRPEREETVKDRGRRERTDERTVGGRRAGGPDGP